MNIASLFAKLGLNVDEASFAAADAALAKTRAAAEKAMAAVAAQAEHFDQVVLDTSRAARGEVKDAVVSWDGWEAGAKRGIKWSEVWGKVTSAAATTARFALRAVMAMFVGGAILKGIGAIGDAYTSARSKINGMTDDVAQQERLQASLFKSAQDTASEYGAVASLYQQVGKAAQDSGRTLEQGAQIVDTINKAIKASGASADGASAALTQLAQGLGSGTLRGEEFNSVIEQAPFLIDLIAKDMGKTRGEMRKLAEGGKLTSKVVLKALENQRGAVDEAFAKRIPQIGDLFVRLRNEASKALSEVFQKKEVIAGLTALFKGLTIAMIATIKAIAAVALFFSRHTGVLVALLAALAAAYIYMGVSAAAAWLAALWPIALVVAAIAAFIYYFEDLVALFFAGFMKMGEGIAWLLRKFRQLVDKIKGIGRSIRDFFRGVADAVRGVFVGVINWIIGKLNWAIDKINWLLRQANRLPGVDLGTIGTIDKVGGKTASMMPTRSPGAQQTAMATINADTTIEVHSPNADPAAVATEVDRKMATFWDRQMRNAYAGTGGTEIG